MRIALVTGGGSGIGRASALALSAAGYAVVVAGRRPNELEKTASMAPAPILAVQADVSQPDSVNALFTRIEGEFGGVSMSCSTTRD